MNEQNNINSSTPVEYTTSLNDLNDPPKQKKSPVGGIIIFLLVRIVIALVAYIAYDNGYLDKLLNKEETTEKIIDNSKKDIDAIKEKVKNIDFVHLIYAEFENSEPSKIDRRIASILDYVYKNSDAKDLTLNEYYEMINCTADNCKDYEVEPVTIIEEEKIKDYYKEFFGELPASHHYLSINISKGYKYKDVENKEKNYYIARYKQDLNGSGMEGYTVSYDETVMYNEEYSDDDNYYYLTFNYALIRHIQEEQNGVYGEWYTETYNGAKDLLNTNQTIDHPEKRNVTIDDEKSKKLPRVKVYIKKDKNLYIEKIELLDEK